jgi:hypothetical protein
LGLIEWPLVISIDRHFLFDAIVAASLLHIYVLRRYLVVNKLRGFFLYIKYSSMRATEMKLTNYRVVQCRDRIFPSNLSTLFTS